MTRDVHHAGQNRDEVTMDDVHAERDDVADDAVLSGDYTVGETTTQNADSEPDSAPTNVVCCRHCEQEFRRVYDYDQHEYTCEPLQHAVRREQSKENEESVEDIDRTYFIRSQWHEFKAYVKYDVGLGIYYGLNSLQKEHDFRDDGALKAEFGVPDDIAETTGRERWELEFSFSDSKLKPWRDSSFRIENVREYSVKMHPAGVENHRDALRKASFNVRPRWPNLESEDGYRDPSNPHDLLGIDVEYTGSNIDPRVYPKLFYQAMGVLQGQQGKKWSNPTYIPYDDVRPENIHHSSNITDGELYVRLDKDLTGPLYAIDGPIHRISMLLADERRGYAKSIRDDRECEGYYHVATIDHERAGELLGGHVLGKEFKHYHVRNPDAVEGDATLEHPKFGVALQNSVTDRTVYWDDLRRVETELDEALLNALDWTDIPIRPDGQVYVEDDVFEVTGERRFRNLVPNRLPSIQQEQHDDVMRVVPNLAPTDVEIAEELLTDGGQIAPKNLAEDLGRHIDTVYTSLKRLGSIVVHEYGDVRLRSKNVAQEILKYLRGAKESFQVSMSEAADRLVQAEKVVDGDSAFARWRETYGVEFDDREGEPDELTMKYTPESKDEVRRILRTGANRWSQLTGKAVRQFAFEVRPAVRLADGTVFAPQYWVRSFG
ncbi:hypothetical protein A4G99_13845 [Haladaptatus sp. R4]|uniref:DUF7845 domain-containing protein n=1 Tax=Haladaptatus sp. R4 TaxID=1679489 RepID=UPI0007B4A83E|nr:hypothetical protein [Haladaptatus sp. R4]KZN23908.1 hypothetical protein A4G99_13845 [Haladaptatus sp. R4]